VPLKGVAWPKRGFCGVRPSGRIRNSGRRRLCWCFRRRFPRPFCAVPGRPSARHPARPVRPRVRASQLGGFDAAGEFGPGCVGRIPARNRRDREAVLSVPSPRPARSVWLSVGRPAGRAVRWAGGCGGGRVLVCRGVAVGRAWWWSRAWWAVRCLACGRAWGRLSFGRGGFWGGSWSVVAGRCGGAVVGRAACRFAGSGCGWRGGVCPASLPVVSSRFVPGWALRAGACPGLGVRG